MTTSLPASVSPAPIALTPELMQQFALFLQQQGTIVPAAAKLRFRDVWKIYEDYGLTQLKGWHESEKYIGIKLLEFMGDVPYDEITIPFMTSYRAWRGKQFSKNNKTKLIGPGTRNRECRTAQAALIYVKNALPKLMTEVDAPLGGMKDEEVPATRDFALKPEQCAELVVASPRFLRLFLIFLWETGCRRDEARLAPWHEFNIEAGYWDIPKERTKGNYPRRITLSTAALAVLELQRLAGSPWVFSSERDPHKVLGERPIHRAFTKVLDITGIKGPRGQKVWLHTLRHSFATEMCKRSDMPLKLLMEHCGWKSQVVFDRYANIAAEDMERTRKPLDLRAQGMMEILSGKAKKPTK